MVRYNTAEQLHPQAPQRVRGHVPGHVYFDQCVDALPAESLKRQKTISFNVGMSLQFLIQQKQPLSTCV